MEKIAVQDGDKREVIIIRRRPDDQDEAHHGGVWKIAYADFMTAMMAFFLVMWLINATDSDTKRTVAHYFNPIKLADTTDDRKGIGDPKVSSDGADRSRDAAEPNASTSKTAAATSASAQAQTDKSSVADDRSAQLAEGRLFQDPYAVLSDLAKNASKEALHPDFAPDRADKARSGQNGLNGGNEFRDPFDPVYWKAANLRGDANALSRGTGSQEIDQMGVPDAEVLVGPQQTDASGTAAAQSAATARDGDASTTPTLEGGGEPGPQQRAKLAAAEVAHKPDRASSKGSDDKVAGSTSPAQNQTSERTSGRTGATAATKPPEVAVADAAIDLAQAGRQGAAADAQAQSLARQLGEALGRPGADKPQLDVVAQKDGILISLMDSAKGAMFAIGSAEPKPDLVVEVARIGAILAKQKGQIIIGGHTDARPFHNAAYDNWRLSSARAQMAYYMLLRGGLPEDRVVRVEGYADHQPKIAGDPMAAANRRIDILLRHESAQ